MNREQRLEAILRELNDHLSFGDAPSELLDRVDVILAEPAPAQTEREAKAWPALAGIGRDSGHPRAVVLYLRHEPSDEHLRMIQEALRTRPAQAEPAAFGFDYSIQTRTATGTAQAEPAPAQDELEAPEVVAVLYKSGDVLTAEECGIALEVCAKVETPLMTVAQHNRIVASLTRATQTGQHIHTAGQRLYEELRQWLATEHDPDSQAALQAWREAIAQAAPQHPDDEAVDRFATAMKVKLAAARAKGRGGWDDPSVCSVEFLAQLLVEHLGKGNAGTFEDVANFAMMLHQRGADPTVLANATRPAQTEQQPAYVECRECTDCGHVGINDAHQTDATCAMCDWSGPSPVEDQCPDCGKENVMGAACPKCSGRYRILAETHVAAPIAQTAPQPKE